MTLLQPSALLCIKIKDKRTKHKPQMNRHFTARLAFINKHYRQLARLRRYYEQECSKLSDLNAQIGTIARAIGLEHPFPPSRDRPATLPFLRPLGTPEPFPSLFTAQATSSYTDHIKYEPDGYSSDPCTGSKLRLVPRVVGRRR